MDKRAKIRILSENGAAQGTRLFIDGHEQSSVRRIEIAPITIGVCTKVVVEYIAPALEIDIEMAPLHNKDIDKRHI